MWPSLHEERHLSPLSGALPSRHDAAGEQRPAPLAAPTDPPTLALFAADHPTRAATRAKLPLGATVVTVAAWATALEVAPVVDCVLLVRAPDDASDLAPLVRELVATATTAPIVVAADAGAGERAAIGRAGARAVAGARAGGRELWGTVQRVVSDALLARAARSFGEIPLAPPLRAALVELCVADPPRASVAALCGAVGVHRRTLWYQWRRQVGEASPRLEDAVTSAVLLRAFMARSAGEGWSTIARRDGIHRHTLARSANRLLALPALPSSDGRQSDVGHAAARRALIENVVRPVLCRQIPYA